MEDEPPKAAPAPPRTARGWRTREKLLRAAEEVFGREGFWRASMVDITRTAKVGQGTFYLYFASKEAVLAELVRELGHQMRGRLTEAAAAAPDRAGAERLGFRAFFDFVSEHPYLYRIVRECEFAAPDVYREWYSRLGEGYTLGIAAAMERGEFRKLDPDLVATCFMAVGDFFGMRMMLWEGRKRVPPRVVETILEVMLKGLLPDGAAR